MKKDVILDDLIEGGILSVDGDELALTEEFHRRKETVKQEISTRDELDVEKHGLTDESLAVLENHGYLADYYVIDSVFEESDAPLRIKIVLLIDQFRNGIPRTAGAPHQFLPIRGDQIDFITDLFSISIVYIWRENCPPCDAMKQEFEEIFSDERMKISPFAVYGPGWGNLLRSKYQVVGAPTTLFVRGGVVDARLLGSHHAEELLKEINKIIELDS